jgi:hypothetical protein
VKRVFVTLQEQFSLRGTGHKASVSKTTYLKIIKNMQLTQNKKFNSITVKL